MVIMLSSLEQAFPAACAVARAFPLYSRKNVNEIKAPRTVHVNFLVNGKSDAEFDYAGIQLATNGVRFAARLGDTPARYVL